MYLLISICFVFPHLNFSQFFILLILFICVFTYLVIYVFIYLSIYFVLFLIFIYFIFIV